MQLKTLLSRSHITAGPIPSPLVGRSAHRAAIDKSISRRQSRETPRDRASQLRRRRRRDGSRGLDKMRRFSTESRLSDRDEGAHVDSLIPHWTFAPFPSRTSAPPHTSNPTVHKPQRKTPTESTLTRSMGQFSPQVCSSKFQHSAPEPKNIMPESSPDPTPILTLKFI